MNELEKLKYDKKEITEKIELIEHMDAELIKVRECFQPNNTDWVTKISFNSLYTDGRIEVETYGPVGLTEGIADWLIKTGYYVVHISDNHLYEKDMEKWRHEYTVKPLRRN